MKKMRERKREREREGIRDVIVDKEKKRRGYEYKDFFLFFIL